jgi:arylsulfatase A-like enzyme
MTTFNGAQFGLFTQRALTERRYKYIWNATDVDELYDLREDPDEMVNRIADPAFARVLADMRARLHAELAACSDNIARSRWLQGQFLSGEKLQPF